MILTTQEQIAKATRVIEKMQQSSGYFMAAVHVIAYDVGAEGPYQFMFTLIKRENIFFICNTSRTTLVLTRNGENEPTYELVNEEHFSQDDYGSETFLSALKNRFDHFSDNLKPLDIISIEVLMKETVVAP